MLTRSYFVVPLRSGRSAPKTVGARRNGDEMTEGVLGIRALDATSYLIRVRKQRLAMAFMICTFYDTMASSQDRSDPRMRSINALARISKRLHPRLFKACCLFTVAPLCESDGPSTFAEAPDLLVRLHEHGYLCTLQCPGL